MIAYMLEEQDRCSLCGTAQWEWEENPFAYEPVGHWCKGCYLKAAATNSDDLEGTTVELLPTVGIEASKRLLARKQQWETRYDAATE